MGLEFSVQIFEKYPNYLKIRRWGPNCSVRMDGRTDKHDEANIRFLKFCEST